MVIACAGVLLTKPAHAVDTEQGLVGIFISEEIRPFILMVEGLEESVGYPTCRIFLDRDKLPYSQDPRCKDLSPENYTQIVAVGPNALTYLKNIKWSNTIVYSMILNPERMLDNVKGNCGVSLNIPPEKQFEAIKSVFPDIHHIGVLYDPVHNSDWFNSASIISKTYNIFLTPLKVFERSEISKLFKETRLDIDAILFIPDKTVISQPIIKYVIKESIKQRIPTFGFNQFFHESGSAMSFVIDYKAVGAQTADMVKNISGKGECAPSGPFFKIYLNRNVIRTLELETSDHLPDNTEVD